MSMYIFAVVHTYTLLLCLANLKPDQLSAEIRKPFWVPIMYQFKLK